MEPELQRRIAANEVVLRDVNEGIRRGQWQGDEHEAVGFRCECAHLGCNRLIELTVLEYERIRSNPRRFVVLAGHEIADTETVIQVEPGYLIVEKREEGGRLAAVTDPRA